MNCLRSLEHWDRGFESHSMHGCLYFLRLFCVCVFLCVGRGHSTDWSPFRGVLTTVYGIKKLKKRPRSNIRLQRQNNNFDAASLLPHLSKCALCTQISLGFRPPNQQTTVLHSRFIPSHLVYRPILVSFHVQRKIKIHNRNT
jgi:hypothetical protein